MPDMLVNLYDIDNMVKCSKGIIIKRVLAPDRYKIVLFVKENFGDAWASECECAFSNSPISCYIALKGTEIVGFACYDATCKNFFGPTGVKEEFRGKGIGSALLKKSLLSMKENGYAYAIIGSVGPVEFYEKEVNAIIIESSDNNKNIYSLMINNKLEV